MRLAEVVVGEVESYRSLEVLELLAKSIRQPSEPSAVHAQRMVLLLDMAGRNAIYVWHPLHNCLFGLHNLCRAIPTGSVFVEVDHRVGLYQLRIINFAAKAAFHSFG